MKQKTGKRALEGFKVFPFIAWGLTIGFAIFVYQIVQDLQVVTADLKNQTEQLQRQIDGGGSVEELNEYLHGRNS